MAKPGQKMRTVFPYKSYCFNIFTRDPELCALLDQLPTAFSLWNMETVLEPLRQMIMLRPAQSLNQRLLVQSYACQILSALSHYRQADEAAVRSVAKHRAALINVEGMGFAQTGSAIASAALRQSSKHSKRVRRVRCFKIRPAPFKWLLVPQKVTKRYQTGCSPGL